MKLLLLILLFLIPLSANALTYQQDGFSLTGNPETGWIFLTPRYDYFAKWFNEELWSMWIERETQESECLIIREGNPEDCSLQEFSIILSYYPLKNYYE